MEDTGFTMENIRSILARTTLKDSVPSKYFSNRFSGALLLNSEGGLWFDDCVEQLFEIVHDHTDNSSIHDFSYAGHVLADGIDLFFRCPKLRVGGYWDKEDQHQKYEVFGQFSYSGRFKHSLLLLALGIASRYDSATKDEVDDEFVDEENNEDENNE
jgi:hypothetical protein